MEVLNTNCKEDYTMLFQNPDVNNIVLVLTRSLAEINERINIFVQLWNLVDTSPKDPKAKVNWKHYRFIDTLEVCAQETERVLHCLQGIPAKELISKEPLMLLEQRYGLWQPYISDDSDDEDWTQETSSFLCHETDEDEIQSESESDLEIIE